MGPSICCSHRGHNEKCGDHDDEELHRQILPSSRSEKTGAVYEQRRWPRLLTEGTPATLGALTLAPAGTLAHATLGRLRARTGATRRRYASAPWVGSDIVPRVTTSRWREARANLVAALERCSRREHSAAVDAARERPRPEAAPRTSRRTRRHGGRSEQPSAGDRARFGVGNVPRPDYFCSTAATASASVR
jgi:hypothetical protein